MTDVEPREDADVVGVAELPANEADVPVGPVEPEPTEEAAGEASAAEFSEALLGRASGYGLSQADLEGLDERRVERMFSAIDRRIMQPEPAVPGQAVGQPLAPAPAQAGVPQYAPLKLELGDDLDESVMNPIRAVVEHINQQMSQVHASRQQVAAELQAMNVLREFSDFDRFLVSLGDDWTKDYGSGATVDMNPQSAEFKKRLEVHSGAKSLRTDAQRRGPGMSVSDALTRSHRAVHWDRIAERERDKLNGKIDRRRKGFTERVTKSKTPAMSPRDEAIEAWNK